MALSKVVNNSIESVDAAKLSGTIADARFPATLPAISGANLTNMAGGGAWTLINTAVASNSSSLTITGLDSTYDTYAIAISDMVPSTNNAYLQMQLGDSNGLDTGGTDYTYHCSNSSNDSTAYVGQQSFGNVWIRLPGPVGSGAGEGIGGILHLNRPGDGTTRPIISGTMTFISGYSTHYGNGGQVIGTRTAVIAVDRVGVHFSAGNIASGRMTVWGISHA